MIDPALLPALHDLVCVARYGSVAAASDALHKTPSAVSQQVHRLESSFGVKLLERAGRGIRLTAAGETVVGPAARLFEEAEAVLHLLSELRGNAVATVRVAISDYLGKDLLAPVVRELGESGALLRFEITTAHSSESLRLLERREVDIAVVTSLESKAGLTETRLFEQRFVWVAPRREGLAAARTLADRLRSEPLLRLAPQSVGRRMLEDYLTANAIEPLSTIDVPSVSLLLSYAAAGVGIGLAPALPLGELERRALVVTDAEVPALPVKVVLRASYRATPPIQSFLDRLISEARRLGSEQRGGAADPSQS